jgi:hypothetical protein
MKPWNSKIWREIEDVEVTNEHLNRAISLLPRQTATQIKSSQFETVMLLATAIAYLRALKDRGAEISMVAQMVCNEFPVEIQNWMMEAHGLIDPFDANFEIEARERQQRTADNAERAAAAKVRREAKRTDEIETEVQKRLAMAA